MRPTLYIIAGCNGAGKTTASYSVLPDLVNCREFVNADEIAKGTMTGNLNPHCGSCIRQAVQKTYDAIIKLEKELENDKQGIKKED